MLYFLLFLFIVFVVIPIASALYKIWQLRMRVNDFVRDPFGTGRKDSQRRTATGPQQPAPHRKKIDPSVGEYVAFTEIEVTETTTSQNNTTTNVRVEQQVVDVEWEDIPDKK